MSLESQPLATLVRASNTFPVHHFPVVFLSDHSPLSRLPAAKRKTQLLDTAATVFASMGYHGTTTAELAKAAGVSEPIIYRHFKSKKGLFIELIERTGQDTLGVWKKNLADLSEPAERLLKLLASNPMVEAKAQVRYRVIVQAMTETQDPEITAALQGHIQKLHTFIAQELLAAQDAGVAKAAFSAELVAWLLIHIALGYGTLTSLGVPGQGTDVQGRHIDEIIAGLVLKHS